MKETWRPVPEFPMFFVNRNGLIRRSDGTALPPWRVGRYLAVKFPAPGKRWNRKKKRFEPRTTSRGLASVVASAFIGPLPKGGMIRLRNGRGTDCRADNLEYVPRSYRSSLEWIKKGEASNFARLIVEQVAVIRASKSPGRYFAEKYGVAESTVSAIRRRKTWKKI